MVGNVVSDPEVREVGKDNTKLAKFPMALNRRFTSKGEKQEETTYVDVEVWGKTAETVEKFVTKGKPLSVIGRIKQDRWEDKDGNNRSKLICVCEELQFLPGSKPTDGGGGNSAPAQSTEAPASNDNSGDGDGDQDIF